MKAAGLFLAGMAAIAVMFPAGLTARADAIKTESVSVSRLAASSGAGSVYRTQDEIRSYIASHTFSTTDAVTYSGSPDLTPPYTDAGALTPPSLQNGLNALNTMRYIAGLSEVTLNNEYNALCQDAAYISMLNGSISHYPSRPAGVSSDIFDRGYAACAKSNLAAGYQNLAVSVLQYMDDSDPSNIRDLGHRRWCLNPSMKQTGFGQADDPEKAYAWYSAMYAFDSSRGSTDISGVCWPARNMPIQYFGAGQAWSWSLGSAIEDSSAVSVTLTRKTDGSVWRFTNSAGDGELYIDNDAYGQAGCVIFLPKSIGGYEAGDVFDVRIDGTGAPVSYTVSFFSADASVAAVTGLTASPSPTSVTLSWNKNSAADSYQVDICRNGVWSYLTRTAGTSYEATGLAPNTSYQFRVYAFRDGEHSASASVSVTTRPPEIHANKPTVVTGFTASPSDNSITLSWNANPNADRYQIDVFRDGSWVFLTKTTGTSYTATGLSSGTSYRFRIFAFKGNQYSVASSVAAVTGGGAKPTAVTGFSAAASENSVDLSWNKNSTADFYQVEVFRDGGWSYLTRTQDTSYTASGLVSGTSYRFRIFAFKGKQYSVSSSVTAATGGAAKPTAVTGFSADAGEDSVTLSWNKNSTADSYQIDLYKNGRWTYLAKVTGTSYTAAGLKSGTEYRFRIFAFRGSEYSSSVSVTASAGSGGKPAPVTNLTAVPASENSIKLAWSKSENADSYQVEIYKNKKWTYLAKVTGTTYTAAELSAGTDYQFRVFAFNGSKYSASTRLETSTKPAAVTGLAAIPSPGGIQLTWRASTGADSYQVDMYKDGKWVYVGKTASTNYTVTGLSSGYFYNFRVYAYKGSAYSASAVTSAFSL